MTNEQRKSIVALRSQGYGYTAIARAIGLSKDSVKAYCRSHGIAGVVAESNARLVIETEKCPNCSAPLAQRPKVKRKRFCCKSCRQQWWNNHREQINAKTANQHTCPACGKNFTAYANSHRKYCSHGCYIKARFGGSSV